MSRKSVDRAAEVVVGLTAAVLLAGGGSFFWLSKHGDPSAINGALWLGGCGVVVLIGLLVGWSET